LQMDFLSPIFDSHPKSDRYGAASFLGQDLRGFCAHKLDKALT